MVERVDGPVALAGRDDALAPGVQATVASAVASVPRDPARSTIVRQLSTRKYGGRSPVISSRSRSSNDASAASYV